VASLYPPVTPAYRPTGHLKSATGHDLQLPPSRTSSPKASPKTHDDAVLAAIAGLAGG